MFCSHQSNPCRDMAPLAVEQFAMVLSAAFACGILLASRRKVRRHLDSSFFFSEVAVKLPADFAAWEQLAKNLATLNQQGSLRAALQGMPPLHVRDLSLPELRRARVILGALVSSYVNGHSVPWHCLEEVAQHSPSAPAQRFAYRAPSAPSASPSPHPPVASEQQAPVTLPLALATAWQETSSRLGMPPVVTATDLDLWNRAATPVSNVSPREGLTAFCQTVSLTGTESERAFHALPFALQRVFSPLLPRLLTAPDCMEARDAAAATDLCMGLKGAIDDARALLPWVYTGVDVAEFYDVYRPLLSGWGERGLRLPAVGSTPRSSQGGVSKGGVAARGAAGADEEEVEIVSRHGGPSAGQTAIIMLIDMALGVNHGPQLQAFQHAMREYMPSEHRALLVEFASRVARTGSLGDAAGAPTAPRELVAAHAAAIESLGEMRRYHYRIASHFLRPALSGTGGSDFRSMLNEGVKSTLKTGKVR